MRKLLKMITGLLVALTVAFGVQATTVAPASASANGCDSWAAFSWGGLPAPVPGGFLCHRIFGSGTRVDYEDATFSAHSNFCNWRIDFRYFDTAGQNYATSYGPTNLRCNVLGSRARTTAFTLRPGRACAYLYTNGIYTTKQCHSITY
ncbi:MAG TPA: hypothetical protein PKK40_06125 [Marmoricola sp.]|nr:hypothetical protein [Marmoricola sp.]